MRPVGQQRRRKYAKGLAAVLTLCGAVLGCVLWLTSPVSTRRMLGSPASSKSLLWQDNKECPLKFHRQSYADIRTFKKKPYLVGGKQEPSCINCLSDEGLAGYCNRLTCPFEEQRGFLDYLIGRAEMGAPGYEHMLTMTPCDWYPFFKNRTVWLVGDSLTQEFMKSFQCFMYEFWDLEMVDLKHRVVETDAVRDRVRLGWCANLMQGGRICHHRVNDAPEYTAVLPYFYQGLTGKRNDIVVMNTGIWSNDVGTYTGRLKTFADYYKLHKQELPYFVWRDSIPQFFHTPTGDFDKSEHAICQPIGMPGGGLALDKDNNLVTDVNSSPHLQVVLEGGWRNQLARPVMQQLGIPVIEIWNTSVPIWQYHKNAHDDPNHHDCTHWCQPSGYQIWLYDTLMTLLDHQSDIEKHIKRMPSQAELDVLDMSEGARHIVVDPF